jgi:hypothetical protein
MSLTHSANGKLKPRGIWMPQFDKPRYYALKQFTEALQAEQHEVLQVLLHLGALDWQTREGKARIKQLLEDFRSTPPSESNVPKVSP